jgi:uncharacterized membrane protein YidH (DUF202 family)
MPSEPPETKDSAPRRTYLAAERTQLAWWRTGFAAIAVALAVGRVVPDLSDASTTWPYVVLGVAFAVYGVLAILYGTRRMRDFERGLDIPSQFAASEPILIAMTAFGALLGLAIVALIIVE